MALNEQGQRPEVSQPREKLASEYQVAIIGGGLSGIALARQLHQLGVNYCVVDSEPAHRSQSVHYLTTSRSAASLGLSTQFQDQENYRHLITGYARYDATQPGLVKIESLDPDPSRSGGFVTLTKQQIKDQAVADGVNIFGGMPVVNTAASPDRKWNLTFRDNQLTTASILVDATGAQARIARSSSVIDPALIDNRTVRYCYGAVFDYKGPEDQLIFADKFPASAKINAREGAGWIMPLGNGKAEVVVGWEGRLKDSGRWYQGNTLELLRNYCDWFNQRGIGVDFSSRSEVVSGVFSQQPLNIGKLDVDKNLLLFGESLGLNHPINGYLISDINDHAKAAARSISERLRGNSWKPYETIYSQSKVMYGPQVTLSQKKMAGAASGIGRSAATADLQSLLVASLSPQGLWHAIDGGLPVKQVILGLINNPQYAPVVAGLGIDYLSLLLRDDLYRQEIWLKVRQKFQ